MEETEDSLYQYRNWKLSLGVEGGSKEKDMKEGAVMRARLQKGWRMEQEMDEVEL